MTDAANQLPITETLAPTDAAEAVGAMRHADANKTSVYPIGGGSSLNYGLPAKRQGVGLSLAKLNRVVDYPARDMTITVEAGVTMATLAQTLAAEGQRLPLDVPQDDAATLGGVMATNFSGPRRYGGGTMRDYVIGVSAIDGTGTPFKGGGRVVKNVAGYDFCKLLTGSLGTLAVITQITLKVRPIPQAAAILYHDLPGFVVAEERLAALVNSQVTPVAIELLAGPAWRDDQAFAPMSDNAAARLVVGLEGTAEEVAWMERQLADEWREQSVRAQRVEDDQVDGLWRRLAAFPAQADSLVIKASLTPAAAAGFAQRLLELDTTCSIQAHAGNGIVIARCGLPAAEVSQTLITQLQPAARAVDGNLIVLSYPDGVELTRQAIWGSTGDSQRVMRAVKEKFDPRGILNPGRFVY